jgi:malate dehydrogenase (oxaloacetate-decarboxylating)
MAVIVTDGTAILGLGNIGPVAGLPVMEGKSLLFKILGETDVIPFCINPAKEEEEVELIHQATSNFMAVNLEDIKAPECFGVEAGLLAKENTHPIFHDDQHGTAIVTLSALINALKLTNKDVGSVKIVINGAGAAGITIAKLILSYGGKNIIVCDSKGAIYEGRKEGMNGAKKELATLTNKEQAKGSLEDVLQDADVFIGVSAADALKGEWVRKMKNPIIFAMANPNPEIMPEDAKKNGAFIYGSGRSDFENQINNSLVFPGIFRGIREHHVKQITMEIKTRVAIALARCVPADKLTVDFIIPNSLDLSIGKMISDEIGFHMQKL